MSGGHHWLPEFSAVCCLDYGQSGNEKGDNLRALSSRLQHDVAAEKPDLSKKLEVTVQYIPREGRYENQS